MSNTKGEYQQEEEEPLFEIDIEVEEEPQPLVLHGSSSRALMLSEAWQLWSDLTHRPDRSRVHPRFRTTYLDLLSKNWPHEDMLEIIKGAARMHPRPNDRLDIRRVLMPLTNYNHERAALALLRDEADVIRFRHVDTYTTKSAVSDVEEALSLNMIDWTEDDIEASGILIRDHDADELKELGKKIKLYLGSITARPVDVLRYRSVADSLKVRTAGDRRSYDAGAKETAQFLEIQDIDFTADRMATDMLLKSRSITEIRAVHLDAPDGYWKRVNTLLESGELTHKQVYQQLRDEFEDWHPSHRKRD